MQRLKAEKKKVRRNLELKAVRLKAGITRRQLDRIRWDMAQEKPALTAADVLKHGLGYSLEQRAEIAAEKRMLLGV